jgi:cytochrome b561
MNIRNAKDDYGLIAKVLHWLIAVCMIGLIPIGWYMSGLSDERLLYWRLLDLHEAIGLSLFIIVPIKLVWRMFSPNPRPLRELSRWERRAARIVHELFVIAIVIIPVTGFLFVASNGEAVKLYGAITIPDIGRLPANVRDMLSEVHYYASYGCAALIAVHILAALKHRFVDLNDSLGRMTF